MEIQGHVQNGMIVLDGALSLPEGGAVTVTIRSAPAVRSSENPKRLEFPLVPSSAPGSIHLSNERVGEILEEEDLETLKRD